MPTSTQTFTVADGNGFKPSQIVTLSLPKSFAITSSTYNTTSDESVNHSESNIGAFGEPEDVFPLANILTMFQLLLTTNAVYVCPSLP